MLRFKRSMQSVRPAVSLLFVAIAVTMVACGGSSGGTSISSGGGTTSTSQPTITSVSPQSAVVGSTAMQMAVFGAAFVGTSVVEWNGAPLATTYVSATELTASIPAADFSAADVAAITVVNPANEGGASAAATFSVYTPGTATAPTIRQYVQYNSYPGTISSNWTVTLNGVQAGSTIYVVGTWPNPATTYPTMAVSDGSATYTLIDRYDDTNSGLPAGIQGDQSIGHWYRANVPAGNYTINMAPNPGTYEDEVGIFAAEIAGASATPLDGHGVNRQGGVAPGTDALSVSATNANASGLMIAVAMDESDGTLPTLPLAGTGFAQIVPLWDFFLTTPPPEGGPLSGPAGGSESQVLTYAGQHTATFSPQEPATSGTYPNYLMVGAIFY